MPFLAQVLTLTSRPRIRTRLLEQRFLPLPSRLGKLPAPFTHWRVGKILKTHAPRCLACIVRPEDGKRRIWFTDCDCEWDEDLKSDGDFGRWTDPPNYGIANEGLLGWPRGQCNMPRSASSNALSPSVWGQASTFEP